MPRVAGGRGSVVEDRLEADREARMARHPTDRPQHARHERGPVRRVVADREGLALSAEDHLLVGDETGQPDRVDPDVVDGSPADARDRLLVGATGVSERAAAI